MEYLLKIRNIEEYNKNAQKAATIADSVHFVVCVSNSYIVCIIYTLFIFCEMLEWEFIEI